MAIDRDRLVRIFDELGQRLAAPATICVIGSTPGIVLGALDHERIRAAVDILPEFSQREIATENMVLVGLLTASGRQRR
jgi:hypothetical protein